MRDDAPMMADMGDHEPPISVGNKRRITRREIHCEPKLVFEISDSEKDVTEDLVGKPHDGPFGIVGAAQQHVRMLAPGQLRIIQLKE